MAAGHTPDDADGTLAAHVAELQRRMHRLAERSDAFRHVRLTPNVLAMPTATLATA